MLLRMNCAQFTCSVIGDSPTKMTERKRPQRPAKMSTISPTTICSAIVTPLTIIFWVAVVIHYHTADALANGTADTAGNGGGARGDGGGLTAASWGSVKSLLQGTADRAKEGGPEYLTPLDLLFFGVIIILALELLSFLVKRSGCESSGVEPRDTSTCSISWGMKNGSKCTRHCNI